MPPRKFNELRDSRASDEAANDLSARLTTWLRLYGPSTVLRTCATCRHMRRVGGALCELANQVPPIDTIMHGCDKFEDELPRTKRENDRKKYTPPEGFEDDDIPF